MPRFEETNRYLCQSDTGRSVIIIEHQKFPARAVTATSATPVFDYMTETGEVVNKIGDGQFLLLLSDELFLVA